MGTEDFVKGENSRLNQQLLFTAEIDRMTDVLRQTLLISKSHREIWIRQTGKKRRRISCLRSFRRNRENDS